MTALRAALVLTALVGLSACASTPQAVQHPKVVARPPMAVVVPAKPQMPNPSLPMANCRPVTIRTEVIDFTVQDAQPTFETRTIIAEFPQTPAERARGMQHRIDPDPATAMLFEFNDDHNPAMWMKDTPASLDIIFISAPGDAFYVEVGTEPFSEMFLTPEEPDPVARYILEVPAGGMQRLNISPGFTTFTFGETQPCGAFFNVA